jgi:SAM-dependent methyltransferase
MTTIRGSWYDYPHYYDLAFRSETRREAAFIEAAARAFCPFQVRRLLEPACGTGRLLAELALRGYDLTGIDLSRPALDYARKRLTRRGLDAALLQADMADFQFDRPFDGAYCLLNSFRHLLSEDAARRNLECVAAALRPGGLYILGFHLLPPDASEDGGERWRERHGKTNIAVTLKVAESSRRRRIERLRVNMLVRTPTRELRLRDEFPLRLYNAAQVRKLFASAPQFELCEVFDFWYEIEEPQALNNDLVDSVFVLRKK